MEGLLFIVGIICTLWFLYELGEQTLIDWSGNDDTKPTPKEVILFIILFMVAQKALMDSFKRKE